MKELSEQKLKLVNDPSNRKEWEFVKYSKKILYSLAITLEKTKEPALWIQFSDEHKAMNFDEDILEGDTIRRFIKDGSNRLEASWKNESYKSKFFFTRARSYKPKKDKVIVID